VSPRRAGLCYGKLRRMADEPQREPVTHKQELAATVTGRAVVSGTATVVRGLNELGLAVLGILVGIALSVAFGVDGPWWAQLLAGVGSFAFACFLVRWPPSRHRLMSFMHWLTGQ
jgi:hypothetical protein